MNIHSRVLQYCMPHDVRRMQPHEHWNRLQVDIVVSCTVFIFTWRFSRPRSFSRVVMTRALSTSVQVLVVTGILLAICTLVIFPRLIKMMGVVTWQRIGCLLGVPIFLAVPNAKFFSWNESSLSVVSALSNFLAFYSITTVRGTKVFGQGDRGCFGLLFRLRLGRVFVRATSTRPG